MRLARRPSADQERTLGARPARALRPRTVVTNGGLTNVEVADIYTRYGHLLLRRCRGLLRDAQLAEDAFQETFIKIMRYGSSFRSATSPLRWLYQTSDRCCFDQLRKVTRRDEVSFVDTDGAAPTPNEVERLAVINMLRKLNDSDRQIAVLTWVDELSQGEVAALTQTSRQTVNKRLQKIRKRAKLMLGDTQ